MRNTVRNSAGNVLLQILAATAVMSTSFYFLTNYVIGQKEQVAKTANLVNVRFALNSAMDYVIFGVRQKYCFSNDDMLLAEPAEKCNLTNTGSVERLIMSVEQENFIRQLLANGQSVGDVDPNNIRLKTIDRYIRVNAASTNHPLFPVLQSLKMVKGADGKPVAIDGIGVKITRDDSAFLPRSGREVYATITVLLKTHRDQTEPIRIGNKDLSISSQIVVYPREVGSFALLVPNDLHLDSTWDAQMEKGDLSIHKFNNRAELGNSQGLVFLSPVFVNKNIHIAVDNGTDETDPGAVQYSAVTFADRVYLGNGWVKSNGSNYTPRTSGGMTDRYWADARTFGGFLKGIENDGGLDLGLHYFAKILSGTVPKSDLMSQCIELTKKQSSREYMYQSKLGVTLNSSENNNFDYRLFLSNGNYFSKQTDSLTLNKDNWGTGTAELISDDYNDAVVKVRVDIGDKWVEAQMPRDATLKLKVQVGSSTYYNSLKSAVSAKEYARTSAVAKYDKLEDDLEAARASLTSWETKLASEEAKPEKKASSGGGTTAPSTTSTSTSTSGASVPSSTTETEMASTSTESSGSSSSSSGTTVTETSPSTEGSTSSGTSSGATSGDKVEYQDPAKIAYYEDQIEETKKTITSLNTQLVDQQKVVEDANYQVSVAKSAVSNYEYLVANPPYIEIETDKVKSYWGFTSYDKLDFQVRVKNAGSLIGKDGTKIAPVVGVQAYDGTYWRSNPIVNPANANLLGYLNFKFDGTTSNLNPPNAVSRTPASTAESLNEGGTDWAKLAEDCENARNAQSSQSFGGAGWNTSFAPSTRTSWNFAGGEEVGKDPGLPSLEIVNSTRSTATFQVRSIVGKCLIDSTSDFVTGFFACDELEIEARSKPLRIIGTFIVGKLRLHPDAIRAGITWSTIYHPQSTKELRAAKILKPLSGGEDCNAKIVDPIWHPIPSVQGVADRMACNTISLRAKADPFQWTSVDPDCGLISGASNTTCKRRLVRFFVAEQSREGGL
ncbi:hypothetical protein AZI85_08875 [Bdellovibrio bacteriovorus]|uniref:Uncharacterized protein n=1 Tax=Bdellovibrio bacteriovorus TaxID=959 RepID=A0A150WDW1_BDEBC|nr:hypothetical protein [Bdellovibrio bacteriovorus]KYG61062.1 hypothetical protein AZI85_08875 [Bdellovibrio bacteriovorus]